MSLLKYPFLASALVLFAGCPGTGGKESDSSGGGGDADTDTDTDTDSDSDSDSDADADESFAVIAWAGEASGDGRALQSGEWGFSFYPYDYDSNTWDDSNTLCHVNTPLEDNGPAPACPACDFAYLTLGVTGGSATGNSCADLGAGGAALVYYPDYDAGSTLGLGFTADYQGYGIPAMYLYQADYAEYGFFLFNFEYPPYYSLTLQGQGSASWSRVIRDQQSGYPFYYAY
jgi:hypothetical protein